jgi:hypothetical protein
MNPEINFRIQPSVFKPREHLDARKTQGIGRASLSNQEVTTVFRTSEEAVSRRGQLQQRQEETREGFSLLGPGVTAEEETSSESSLPHSVSSDYSLIKTVPSISQGAGSMVSARRPGILSRAMNRLFAAPKNNDPTKIAAQERQENVQAIGELMTEVKGDLGPKYAEKYQFKLGSPFNLEDELKTEILVRLRYKGKSSDNTTISSFFKKNEESHDLSVFKLFVDSIYNDLTFGSKSPHEEDVTRILDQVINAS